MKVLCADHWTCTFERCRVHNCLCGIFRWHCLHDILVVSESQAFCADPPPPDLACRPVRKIVVVPDSHGERDVFASCDHMLVGTLHMKHISKFTGSSPWPQPRIHVFESFLVVCLPESCQSCSSTEPVLLLPCHWPRGNGPVVDTPPPPPDLCAYRVPAHLCVPIPVLPAAPGEVVDDALQHGHYEL